MWILSLAICLLVVALPSSAQESGGVSDAVPGMVRVPEGPFWMGRVHRWLIDEIGWITRDRMDDFPAHLVKLDEYYIDTHEVTNADYARFAEATDHRRPYYWPDGQPPEGKEQFPVYNVSWDDALAHCEWEGKRLPTEAEWEKAARGGRDRMLFPWGDFLQPRSEGGGRGQAPSPKKARFGFPNGPVDVGSFPPNDLGVHDAVGNVWEWVADRYETYYYSVSPEENPAGPEAGPHRILRGGSWADRDARLLMVNYRNYAAPETLSPTYGFRCARSPE